MFRESIIQGISALALWQVWVAAIIYVFIELGFLLLTFGSAKADINPLGRKKGSGCLFYMFGGNLLHGVLMGLMVVFLLPIMLGGSSFLPLSAAGELAFPAVKAGIVAVIAVTLLCFIPIAGRFISRSQGLQAFIEGVIIFRILAGRYDDDILDAAASGTVYPGVLSSLAYLLISTAFVYAILYGFNFLSIVLRNERFKKLISEVIGPALGVLGGIIPLFMYSAFVSLAL
jgi:hypothetical protein